MGLFVGVWGFEGGGEGEVGVGEMGEVGEVGEKVGEGVRNPGGKYTGGKGAGDAESIERTHHEVGHEVSAPQEEIINAMPMQEQGLYEWESTAQESGQTPPTQSTYCEFPLLQEVAETTLVTTSSSPQQAALEDEPRKIQHISTSSSSSQHQAASETIPTKTQHTETAKTTNDNAPRFSNKISPLQSEKTHAASIAAPETTPTPTEHIETINPAARVITPRESRRVEKWISGTDMRDVHDTAEGFDGMLEGDDDDAGIDTGIDIDANIDINTNDPNKQTITRRPKHQTARSATSTLSTDSTFQNALRAYMGPRVKKHGYRQKGSGGSATSEGSGSRESGFQGEVRTMIRFGRVGGERRARSL